MLFLLLLFDHTAALVLFYTFPKDSHDGPANKTAASVIEAPSPDSDYAYEISFVDEPTSGIPESQGPGSDYSYEYKGATHDFRPGAVDPEVSFIWYLPSTSP